MKKFEDIKLLDVCNILDEPIPEVNWAVRGMFAKGDLVLFYGKSGSMKSFLLTDMALHLAGGKPWLGQHISKPTSVLYIDEEMGEARMRQRIQRIAKALDFRPITGSLCLLSYSDLKFQVEDIKRAVRGYHNIYKRMPEVIIVETLRATMMGDENNADDVNRMWESVYPIKGIGITVIVSHQTMNDSDDVEIGDGYLLGEVDTAFSVQKKPKDNLIIMKHQKARHNREGEDLKILAVDHGPHENDPISFELAEPEEKEKKSRKAENLSS